MAIRINGISVIGSRNVVIKNGKVIVDGKDVTPEDAKQINIEVTGDVDTIEVDACEKISVTGNTGRVSTSQGDISVGGDVHGPASTSQGNIEVDGSVEGNVQTSMGDIRVRGTVSGNATTTMGNVTHGR